MLFSIESILNFGGTLVCEAGLIDNPRGDSDLTLGYRYALHSHPSESQRYRAVGEGLTIKDAYNDFRNRYDTKSVQRMPRISLNTTQDKHRRSIYPKEEGNWTLSIYTPNMNDYKGMLVGNKFDSTTQGIDSDFSVVTSESGNSISMKFWGRNNILGIKILDIVQLSVDSEPVFYGNAVLLPDYSSVSESLFEFEGVGAKFDGTVLDSDIYLQNVDAIEYIKKIAEHNFPQRIGYNKSKISGNGVTLDAFPSKWKTSELDWVFQNFAIKLPNASYGVDAEGEFFFRYHV